MPATSHPGAKHMTQASRRARERGDKRDRWKEPSDED